MDITNHSPVGLNVQLQSCAKKGVQVNIVTWLLVFPVWSSLIWQKMQVSWWGCDSNRLSCTQSVWWGLENQNHEGYVLTPWILEPVFIYPDNKNNVALAFWELVAGCATLPYNKLASNKNGLACTELHNNCITNSNFYVLIEVSGDK